MGKSTSSVIGVEETENLHFKIQMGESRHSNFFTSGDG
jgi:hypothetical protein